MTIQERLKRSNLIMLKITHKNAQPLRAKHKPERLYVLEGK